MSEVLWEGHEAGSKEKVFPSMRGTEKAGAGSPGYTTPEAIARSERKRTSGSVDAAISQGGAN